MKYLFSIIAIMLMLVSYVPYICNTVKGKVKPHSYSWLIWGVLASIVFVSQLTNGGGVGSFVAAFNALLCIAVFILAILRGEKNITKLDRASLMGAGVALLAWLTVKDALVAIFFVCMVDGLGFIPTFRKTHKKPNEEMLSMYYISVVQLAMNIASLENLTIANWLYPAFLIVTNSLFIGMVVIRRYQLNDNNKLVDTVSVK